MNARHYADGTAKQPHLGTFCHEGKNHRICGGWWCSCECHDGWDISEGGHVRKHVEHEWCQTGGCVYCEPCGTRLYQGRLAEGEEKEAMAAIFDSLHEKIAKDWAEMRAAVVAARDGEGVSE